MKKIKKFFKSPGIFMRDYFNNRYPLFNIEQCIKEPNEAIIFEHTINMASMENHLYTDTSGIDVVFTWVDNNDLKWREKYQAHLSNSDTTKFALYSQDSARFENHNELYYSLHSVENFLPWARKIYIVTDNQTPSWFKQSEHPKVTIIDHTAIIDSQYLPTFNSHVIEAHLHNIPDLSEQFIYFNDDVFVARVLPQEHFFHPNGIASIFIADKKISTMLEKGVITPTLKASLNSINLLKNHYNNISINKPLVHTYVPLFKSVFRKDWRVYNEQIINFIPNKFRTNADLNLATFLIPWLMYLEGRSTPSWEICYYFNIRSANALTQYRKLLQKKGTKFAPHSICANDFNSNQQFHNYQNYLAIMLKEYYSL